MRHVEARYFVCDIRREETVEAMVQGVLSAFGGRIDVLVNNAGGQYMTAAEHCKPKVCGLCCVVLPGGGAELLLTLTAGL